MPNPKLLFGLAASGGFGGLASLATAAWASPGVVEATSGGTSGLEVAGVGDLIAMLVYLLQASTKERVAEAKEYADLMRSQMDAHNETLKAERAEQFAQMGALRQAGDQAQARLLQFYEHLLTQRTQQR